MLLFQVPLFLNFWHAMSFGAYQTAVATIVNAIADQLMEKKVSPLLDIDDNKNKLLDDNKDKEQQASSKPILITTFAALCATVKVLQIRRSRL